MKYLIVLLVALSAFSQTKELKWSNLYQNQSYNLSQTVNVSDRKEDFSIAAGTKIKLIESTSLPMINVQLFKFELPSCPSNSLKTELELLEIPQENKPAVVVGYDIVENCVLEFFIELKDFYSKSILK